MNDLPLVGMAEIAEIMQVCRQRALVLSRRAGFPASAGSISSVRVWWRDSVLEYHAHRRRTSGRPTGQADS